MKTKILIFLCAVTVCFSCSPDKPEMNDFSNYTVDKVVCTAQSNSLVADNESELILEAALYVKSGEYTDIFGNTQYTYRAVPKDRQRRHDIAFYTADGTPVTNPYKTSSANPSKLEFYAVVDGIRSSKPILQLEAEYPEEGTAVAAQPEPVCFEVNVRKAIAVTTKKRIPVVFHLVDAQYNHNAYQSISSDAVYYVIDLWNSVFGRKADRASNGANPNIEFVPVLRDPSGKKLKDPGINRVLLSESQEPTLTSQGIGYVWNNRSTLYWDCDRYLNVWVFYNGVSVTALDGLKKGYPTIYPEGVYNSTVLPLPSSITADLRHLSAADLAAWKTNPGGTANNGYLEKVGLVFSKSGFASRTSDFVTRMGIFLGVIPNTPYSATSLYPDYSPATGSNKQYMDDRCDDTPQHDIWFWGSPSAGGREASNYGSAQLKYMKSAPWLIFKSTNIAEHASSQTTVTQDQVKRINWVLENAAGRQPWKNTAAID